MKSVESTIGEYIWLYADIRTAIANTSRRRKVREGEAVPPGQLSVCTVRAYKVGSFRVSNNLAWKRDLYETVNLITQFREGARPADGAARPNNLNKQIINIRSRETTSA